MAGNEGVLIVAEDTFIRGKIRNCRRIEIYGQVEGELTAEAMNIHEGGRFRGKVKADNADINGTLEGKVTVRNLISIRSSGDVSGDVQYGQLAMEIGASLSADVRNVPPVIGGDLDLTVYRGRTVGITLEDLTAIDPDDDAKDLTYTVSNARNGFVCSRIHPEIQLRHSRRRIWRPARSCSVMMARQRIRQASMWSSRTPRVPHQAIRKR